jgi:hypothetical protein
MVFFWSMLLDLSEDACSSQVRFSEGQYYLGFILVIANLFWSAKSFTVNMKSLLHTILLSNGGTEPTVQ